MCEASFCMISNLLTKKLVIIVSFVTLLPGCAHLKNKKHLYEQVPDCDSQSCEGMSTDQIKQIEAKLIDVPIPLCFESILTECAVDTDSASMLLTYAGVLSVDEVTSFYMQEMERLGWQQATVFHSAQSLLNFEKPGKFCTVLISVCDSGGVKLLVSVSNRLFLGQESG
jgi:hypothetical protein